MSAAAERMRRLRARRAAGQIVLRAHVDEVGLAEILIGLDLLPPSKADDRDALAEGLSKLVDRLILAEIDLRQ